MAKAVQEGMQSTRNQKRAQSFRNAEKVDDPDKSRSAHIKNLVADRMKEEEIRNKLVTDEIVKMKRTGVPRASSAQRRKLEILFPTTTNQETHNDE